MVKKSPKKVIKRINIKPQTMLVVQNSDELNELRTSIAELIGVAESDISFIYKEIAKV